MKDIIDVHFKRIVNEDLHKGHWDGKKEQCEWKQSENVLFVFTYGNQKN